NNQANYAARIYAEAIALNLQGAFWYTLVEQPPGFDYSSLVDLHQSVPTPRPAYVAFRNSARLLDGFAYIGPPVIDPTTDQTDKVQMLKFQKSSITLYVFWVQHLQRFDWPVIYNLPVYPGALARCTTNLDGRDQDGGNDGEPYRFNCSDSNGDGVIP